LVAPSHYSFSLLSLHDVLPIFYQSALNAESRRFIIREKLGVDFVNRGVIFPVGNKDAVEGHIRHRATRRLYDLADGFQNVAGLRDRKSTRLNSSHVSKSYAVFR